MATASSRKRISGGSKCVPASLLGEPSEDQAPHRAGPFPLRDLVAVSRHDRSDFP